MHRKRQSKTSNFNIINAKEDLGDWEILHHYTITLDISFLLRTQMERAHGGKLLQLHNAKQTAKTEKKRDRSKRGNKQEKQQETARESV